MRRFLVAVFFLALGLCPVTSHAIPIITAGSATQNADSAATGGSSPERVNRIRSVVVSTSYSLHTEARCIGFTPDR